MMSFQNQDIGSNTASSIYETSNIVETKMLYLSTKSSQCTLLNGDMKSHVSYDLKSYLDYQGDDTIQSITLAMPYAILCNSNYQINANNNKLNIILNGGNYTYYFEYGNYSSETFMQKFLSLVPNTFSIYLDPISVKFIITNSTYPFTLLGTSTCDYIMGFSGDQVSPSTAPYIVNCPRCCNFLPNPLFRITIENNTLYNGQVLGSAGNASYSNVLASIPNVTKQNTQIVYQNFSDEFAISPSGQTTLILGILDDSGNYVDFNGISSYFQLRIRLYKRIKKRITNFNELLTNATNLRNLIEEDEEIIEKPISEII